VRNKNFEQVFFLVTYLYYFCEIFVTSTNPFRITGMERKTHRVLDYTYHSDETGHDVMVGTLQECQDFITSEGNAIGYEILQLLKEEIEFENQ